MKTNSASPGDVVRNSKPGIAHVVYPTYSAHQLNHVASQ